ncbi:BrnA antitoxin family protein [Corticibacterium sp. UT-5YL-CI-8]|nr:BrnA antitoxin family protein [Tianweitania sp. UT-5YL-CI-8]
MAIQIRPNPFVEAAPAARAPSGSKTKAGRPHSGKIVVSLRLDPDVVEKFRATGHGWQSRMNDALKAAKPG